MKPIYQTIFLSCLVFLFFLFLLPTHPLSMFTDPDTGWHLAAGDLIRKSGFIPQHDPWSFTAGSQQWFDISWGWDVCLSYAYQHFGWHGVVTMNSITIALTLAFIFAAALAQSEHGIAAFLTTLIVAIAMLNTNVRPHQISFLFIAILSFMLSQTARRTYPPCWLWLMPAMMVVWVNVHGGFLAAFILLGIYAADEFIEKNYRLTWQLAAASAASLAACMVNPYGSHIIAATLRTLNSQSKSFIQEWVPLSFSSANAICIMYIIAFLFLVELRRTPALRCEKWVAYFWLLMAVTSIRHLSIFGIVSAPLLAVGIRNVLLHNMQSRKRTPLAEKICNLSTHVAESFAASFVMIIVVIACGTWLFTPRAARLYDTTSFNPLPDLSPEIDFIETHYPHAKFFNSYSLGGPLIFYTRGKIPLWIDGRAETAYPPEVIKDYAAFSNADPHWAELFDRYHIDGAIIAAIEPMAMDRFIARKGWKLVFKGKHASVFMRDPS